MAFFRPVLEHYKAMSGQVSVSILKARSQKVHLFKVRLGEAPRQALHVKAGDKIEALWGTGSDAGKILIQKAASSTGGRLRHCGRSTSPTLEASLGNMPRLPIMGDGRQRWTLQIAVYPAVRLDWEPYPATGAVQGLMVALPREWWAIEDAGHPLKQGYPRRAA